MIGGSKFTYHDDMENIHGPYVAASFHDPQTSWPFHLLPNRNRTTTMYMDAFASTYHIGMLWSGSNPSAGTDYIAEARGDAYGTNLWQETYRYDSDYLPVTREGWTPDCYPNCNASRARTVAVP